MSWLEPIEPARYAVVKTIERSDIIGHKQKEGNSDVPV